MKTLLLFVLSLPLFAEVGFVEPWGKDSELVPSTSLIPPLPEQSGLMTKLSATIIFFHQNIISPVDGPRSHFRPTSSRYMLLAMRRHGFIKGYIMGCDRLLRENKEEWVYRTVTIDGEIYKWDPTFSSSKRRGSSKKATSS
ncbi:membrane protein insertion efficiency factor YidD [Candidatus Neptunichlamydia sp. REUL1]|uniref:membrane protein insertion efficiency factor YidD n=1 Tax=Candidatus Neptunichlamydia sp. REUL1 TaxID=3064277 RepID=UPI0029302749|nr:membrane protein insertion efficiency factor YidD [Candidatus Neptunochlamydia sp. REUL1]